MSEVLKWGIKDPVAVFDETFGERLAATAYGTCSYHVVDEALFGATEGTEEADSKVQTCTRQCCARFMLMRMSHEKVAKWPTLTDAFAEYAHAEAARQGYAYDEITLQNVSLDEASQELYREIELAIMKEKNGDSSAADAIRQRVAERKQNMMMDARERQKQAEAMLAQMQNRQAEQPAAETPSIMDIVAKVGVKRIATIIAVIIILIIGYFL